MKLILLPGMDGTGKLFQPFINELPTDIDCSVISYPKNENLGYSELEYYVLDKLPKDEEYILLAESFSGPIGYKIAKRNLENMKGIIFVATFLQNPNKLLVNLTKLMPLSLLLAFPVPEFIIKQFFLGKNPSKNNIILFRDALNSVSSNILSFRVNEISKLSVTMEKISTNSFYIQALNDKLVSSNNLNRFTEISDILITLKINGPHFILQAEPKECAEFVSKQVHLITSASNRPT